MTTGPTEYPDRAANAFNRRDVEAMLALVHEDFVYLDAMGMQKGRESIRGIPAHGRAIRVHYAAHFTFKDRLAIREEAFFDTAVLMPFAQQGEG
ncbi:nuclear transport factor 2 family protein [Pseudomonas donghuensis]|uniref:nuclear transport factor 2 family protein n=1 Tax=Pseudomonas donghuensis TaxID=1163398 RepID=UPI002E13E1B0|nr:nuclear transport factor 2 family protein [Pseudomonas donghuensis]